MKLNPAVDNLSPPPIPAAMAWTAQYKQTYGPLIDLSQAVPGYPPPPELLQWLGEASASPTLTGYGPIEGELALREAYAAHVGATYNASLSASQTHITSGCNQAFVASILAIAGCGDTVLMTNPCYFNHESTLSMLGIKTRFVSCDPANDFLPDLDALSAALEGVQAFAIVSPNNPTGSIYPAALLDAIFDMCHKAGVWLIVDETYRDFTSSRHQLFAQHAWPDTFIQLYSFSKSFCIPGHRMGAVIAGKPVIKAVSKVMDNLQICAPRAAQSALARAFEPLAKWRADNRAEIDRRAIALRKTLADLPDWKISSMGAYFAYVRHPFNNTPSLHVAQRMAEDVGVLCLPGSFFGDEQDSYLRIAFANADVETIATLSQRLKQLPSH